MEWKEWGKSLDVCRGRHEGNEGFGSGVCLIRSNLWLCAAGISISRREPTRSEQWEVYNGGVWGVGKSEERYEARGWVRTEVRQWVKTELRMSEIETRKWCNSVTSTMFSLRVFNNEASPGKWMHSESRRYVSWLNWRPIDVSVRVLCLSLWCSWWWCLSSYE